MSIKDEIEKSAASANSFQVGDIRYSRLGIQPWDVTLAWRAQYLEGCIIKDICDWCLTYNLQELRSAQHHLTKLIEHVETRIADQADAAQMAQKVGGPLKPPAGTKVKPVTMTADTSATEDLANMVDKMTPKGKK
jgi:hypothetical protein